jgi:hypothetical protein
MNNLWLFRPLKFHEVSNNAELLSVDLELLDDVGTDQSGEKLVHVRASGREYARFDCQGLPLKCAGIVCLAPQAEEQRTGERSFNGKAHERLVREKTGMNASYAAHRSTPSASRILFQQIPQK